MANLNIASDISSNKLSFGYTSSDGTPSSDFSGTNFTTINVQNGGILDARYIVLSSNQTLNVLSGGRIINADLISDSMSSPLNIYSGAYLQLSSNATSLSISSTLHIISSKFIIETHGIITNNVSLAQSAVLVTDDPAFVPVFSASTNGSLNGVTWVSTAMSDYWALTQDYAPNTTVNSRVQDTSLQGIFTIPAIDLGVHKLVIKAPTSSAGVISLENCGKLTTYNPIVVLSGTLELNTTTAHLLTQNSNNQQMSLANFSSSSVLNSYVFMKKSLTKSYSIKEIVAGNSQIQSFDVYPCSATDVTITTHGESEIIIGDQNSTHSSTYKQSMATLNATINIASGDLTVTGANQTKTGWNDASFPNICFLNNIESVFKSPTNPATPLTLTLSNVISCHPQSCPDLHCDVYIDGTVFWNFGADQTWKADWPWRSYSPTPYFGNGVIHLKDQSTLILILFFDNSGAYVNIPNKIIVEGNATLLMNSITYRRYSNKLYSGYCVMNNVPDDHGQEFIVGGHFDSSWNITVNAGASLRIHTLPGSYIKLPSGVNSLSPSV